MSLNTDLTAMLTELTQDAQQDPKMLNMDVSVATQVRDELTTIMNDRLTTLEPNVVYPWTKTKTPGGTTPPAGTPAAPAKK